MSWQGHFSNDLPDGFDEEIGLGGTSMAVSNNGRTVGYSVEGTIGETMAEIKNHLAKKGLESCTKRARICCYFRKRYRNFLLACSYLRFGGDGNFSCFSL